MRLIIKIGYYSFLFGKGANVSELIAAFDGIKQVEEKGYGIDRRFIESSEEEFPQVFLIPDDSISLPENKTDLMDKYHEKASKCEALTSEVYALKNQIEQMKKAAAAISGEE